MSCLSLAMWTVCLGEIWSKDWLVRRRKRDPRIQTVSCHQFPNSFTGIVCLWLNLVTILAALHRLLFLKIYSCEMLSLFFVLQIFHWLSHATCEIWGFVFGHSTALADEAVKATLHCLQCWVFLVKSGDETSSHNARRCLEMFNCLLVLSQCKSSRKKRRKLNMIYN